jgi:predicted anti-sigma-YlaC factor YlaD
MIHGFSEKDWNDYIEGVADEALRDRIEAHLIGCLGCWEFYERMAHATEALRASAQQLRAELAPQDRDLYWGLRGVFEKINAAEAATLTVRASSHQAIEQKLAALEEVMAPMCGSYTAAQALRTAAVESPARSLEWVTADNWPSFLKRLTSIATVMCGETGAHLVWERGQF